MIAIHLCPGDFMKSCNIWRGGSPISDTQQMNVVEFCVVDDGILIILGLPGSTGK